MSKKKFTNGLESVFDSSENETFTNTTVLEETKQEAAATTKPTVTRRGSKDFSSDIDEIILNSFVTNNDENAGENDNNISNSHVKRLQRRPLNGLEALLTRTIDYNDLDGDTKRRIVLILEQQKVDKLKEIAKSEQLFLKDVIIKSVSSYIDNYDRRK